jgi:hypothetical protein
MIFTDLAKAAYPAPNTEGETVEDGDCRVRRNSSRPSSVMLVRGYLGLSETDRVVIHIGNTPPRPVAMAWSSISRLS